MNTMCDPSRRYSVLRTSYPVLFCLTLFLGANPVQAGPTHVYRAARIWTGNGPPIPNAVPVVRDGKGVKVGPRAKITVPEDAEVHDLGQAVLIPGLVIAETTLGERGRDDDRALTPEFRAIDGFDFYADYTAALSGGVTTVQIAPGSRRLMPGQGAVVKLAGDDPAARTLREPAGLAGLRAARGGGRRGWARGWARPEGPGRGFTSRRSRRFRWSGRCSPPGSSWPPAWAPRWPA